MGRSRSYDGADAVSTPGIGGLPSGHGVTRPYAAFLRSMAESAATSTFGRTVTVLRPSALAW
jgi:hypothetical protein